MPTGIDAGQRSHSLPPLIDVLSLAWIDVRLLTEWYHQSKRMSDLHPFVQDLSLGFIYNREVKTMKSTETQDGRNEVKFYFTCKIARRTNERELRLSLLLLLTFFTCLPVILIDGILHCFMFLLFNQFLQYFHAIQDLVTFVSKVFFGLFVRRRARHELVHQIIDTITIVTNSRVIVSIVIERFRLLEQGEALLQFVEIVLTCAISEADILVDRCHGGTS